MAYTVCQIIACNLLTCVYPDMTSESDWALSIKDRSHLREGEGGEEEREGIIREREEEGERGKRGDRWRRKREG